MDISNKLSVKIKPIKAYLGMSGLIALDQGIKLIINHNFLHNRFTIIPSVLYFEPMFNRFYSWFNSMLQLGESKWIHIILVSVLSLIILLFYLFVNKTYGIHKITNVMFAFIFAGAMCSLIDKIFWDGSLDFIYLNGFFTFDFKDIYINVFIGILIASLVFKNKVVVEISEGQTMKGFLKYLLRKSN